MSSNAFDERLAALNETDGLSYEETINIDALAFFKNWYEQRDTIIAETIHYISDDDLKILEMVGAGERLLEMLTNAWSEESKILEEHVDQSIREALKRDAQRR